MSPDYYTECTCPTGAQPGPHDPQCATETVKRGKCPACGLTAIPLIDGALQLHTTPRPLAPGNCEGSGQQPAEVTS